MKDIGAYNPPPAALDVTRRLIRDGMALSRALVQARLKVAKARTQSEEQEARREEARIRDEIARSRQIEDRDWAAERADDAILKRQEREDKIAERDRQWDLDDETRKIERAEKAQEKKAEQAQKEIDHRQSLISSNNELIKQELAKENPDKTLIAKWERENKIWNDDIIRIQTDGRIDPSKYEEEKPKPLTADAAKLETYNAARDEHEKTIRELDMAIKFQQADVDTIKTAFEEGVYTEEENPDARERQRFKEAQIEELKARRENQEARWDEQRKILGATVDEEPDAKPETPAEIYLHEKTVLDKALEEKRISLETHEKLMAGALERAENPKAGATRRDYLDNWNELDPEGIIPNSYRSLLWPMMPRGGRGPERVYKHLELVASYMDFVNSRPEGTPIPAPEDLQDHFDELAVSEPTRQYLGIMREVFKSVKSIDYRREKFNDIDKIVTSDLVAYPDDPEKRRVRLLRGLYDHGGAVQPNPKTADDYKRIPTVYARSLDLMALLKKINAEAPGFFSKVKATMHKTGVVLTGEGLDPKYEEFRNELQKQLKAYQKLVSGLAVPLDEKRDYEAMYPDPGVSMEINVARMKGIINDTVKEYKVMLNALLGIEFDKFSEEEKMQSLELLAKTTIDYLTQPDLSSIDRSTPKGQADYDGTFEERKGRPPKKFKGPDGKTYTEQPVEGAL